VPDGRRAKTLRSTERRRAIAAARGLFRDPNVLAIGIGERKRDRRPTGEIALVVTVMDKPGIEHVAHGYRVPRKLRVPATRTQRGFELVTDVIVGQRKRFAVGARVAARDLSLRICPEGHGSEGTLGGIVEDQHGAVFLLSCSHVLSDFGRVPIGGPIFELERGRRIARLTRYFDLVPGATNYADVAIAKLASGVVDDLLPRTSVRSVATASPGKGDAVQMFVQDATPSGGHVSQIDVQEKVYGWGGSETDYVVMAGQIEVEDLGVRGDSGAVVTDAQGRAVGLFIADNGSRDLMTPIARVLEFAGKPDITVHANADTEALELSFVPNASE
jgi:hypothetical protein